MAGDFVAGFFMSRIFAACTVFALTLSGCSQNTHAPKALESGPALSENEEFRLTATEYAAFVSRMPDDVLKNYLNNRPGVRELALDVHSMYHIQNRAKEEGVDQIPAIQHEINEAIRKILIGAYLDEQLKEIRPIEDDAILRDRYVALKEHLRVPEKRKFSHILLVSDKECDCKKDTIGMPKLTELLESGSSFEELALKYSADRGSATEGGLIDVWMDKDSKVDPAFFQAGFALKEVGAISKPVKSAVGMHLIRLEAVEPSYVPPFEEVRKTVQATLYKEQRGSRIDEVKAKSYPKLDSLNIDGIQQIIQEEYLRRYPQTASEQDE